MDTTNDLHNLSSDELVHLAMKASSDNKHDYAIQYLKQARQISQDPIALYLLAAEHAEIGMYQQAIEELNTVIAALPELWVARIQLALLQILTGQYQQPIECIQPLLTLPADNHFRHFAKGLDLLTKAEHSQCIEELEKGISLNKEIQPLNKDMQNLIDQILKNTNPDTSSSEDSSKGTHMFINAYNTSL